MSKEYGYLHVSLVVKGKCVCRLSIPLLKVIPSFLCFLNPVTAYSAMMEYQKIEN